MATLAVTQISSAGVVDTLAAAAGGGDVFPNDGRTWFELNNGGVGSINVTFAAVGKFGGETISSRVVAVANGVRKKIGPFDPGIFNNASGQVAVTYDGVTSVTVGAFKY